MKIFITGCSSGVGRELCKEFKRGGNIVIATARKVSSLADLDADLKLELDVTSESSIQNVVLEVIKKYGNIDIIINNAGYSVRGAIEEISLEKAHDLFEVNVYGIIRMIKGFASMFRQAKSGRIVNIGSISGLYTQAANGVYCASKHAVEAITEAARSELSQYNVDVCVLRPGPMETEFFNKLAENSDSQMKDITSPYYSIYQDNIKVRDFQKRCSVEKAAKEMANIIMKTKVKTHYLVAMTWYYKLGMKLHLVNLYMKLHK